MVLVKNLLLADRVHELGQDGSPDQLRRVDRNLFHPRCTQAGDQVFGQLGPLPNDGFLAPLLRDFHRAFQAVVYLRIQLPQQLPFDHPDLLDRVVHLEQIIGRIAERLQQNRGRHLPAAVDPDVQDVTGIKLEV